ncbi:element excision factor XisI family protein [Aphanizomenon sp. CS-733/32]|uniref:element excision factor XisI family protein n=1 Tax=Aphanizomenon sp. CS-733/32 TaxID=3021715 RepID=UPI003FA48125
MFALALRSNRNEWENNQRVHGCLVHIDIINDKIWIQRDGTEYGIANSGLIIAIELLYYTRVRFKLSELFSHLEMTSAIRLGTHSQAGFTPTFRIKQSSPYKNINLFLV